MPNSSTKTEMTQVERVAEQIKQHKEEVARLREELGDPMEALSTFVREHFSYEAFSRLRRPRRSLGNRGMMRTTT